MHCSRCIMSILIATGVLYFTQQQCYLACIEYRFGSASTLNFFGGELCVNFACSSKIPQSERPCRAKSGRFSLKSRWGETALSPKQRPMFVPSRQGPAQASSDRISGNTKLRRNYSPKLPLCTTNSLSFHDTHSPPPTGEHDDDEFWPHPWEQHDGVTRKGETTVLFVSFRDGVPTTRERPSLCLHWWLF
jgi:hypothetical protein